MSTPAQFATRLAAAGHDIAHVETKVAAAAGLTVKKAVQVQLRVAAPRGRLNVGKQGKKIGVRYILAGKTVRVFMTGPAQLIESDTKPHRIPRERKTSRAKRRVVVIPGVGVRAYANHPGTKGKHPWAKGVADSEDQIPQATAKVYFDTVRRQFR